MALTRTNLCPNPRYIGVDAKSGGGAGVWTDEDVATGGPDGGGWTRVTATADATGFVVIGDDATAQAAVTPGEVYAGSAHILPPGDGQISWVRVRLSWRTAAGDGISTANGPQVSRPGPGWKRYSVTGTAPNGAAYARVYADFGYVSNNANNIVAGDVVGVGCRMVEESPTLGAYFDGDTRDTKQWEYAWTGEANASTSTATSLLSTITATVLISSTEPPPIQLTINDVRDGDAYTVTGIAPGGRTWDVAGGHGVSEGVQIVLIDNRAPVNVPVRYRLVTPTGTYDSNTVTRPWAPPDGGRGSNKYLVQSLDGNTVVPIAAWIDNQLPKQPELHTAGFAIRGRRRPVMVLAVAGEGTMSVVWRLDRAASAKLDKIIADGGGIALITDGTARDLPVSDTAVITSASSALWEADNGVSTDRVWDIELTWIDDPEPSTIPVVWDVGEVDALLASKTVGEVDALLAGMTVAQVDALDWGTVTP